MGYHYPRRLLWVVLGMVISAVGIVMMLQANIGLEPWSVLQQGMAQTFGITYGTASIIVGAAAIGVAILFGEGFGLGTILNITLCAIFIDYMLAQGWIPLMENLFSGILMLLGGLELLAIGTWLYMKAALGAGPRDSLMAPGRNGLFFRDRRGAESGQRIFLHFQTFPVGLHMSGSLILYRRKRGCQETKSGISLRFVRFHRKLDMYRKY